MVGEAASREQRERHGSSENILVQHSPTVHVYTPESPRCTGKTLMGAAAVSVPTTAEM